MAKADNMLALLWLLRSGKRLTARQLAGELEIHVRTVYRLIDSLCASGVPIIAESGPNGGYRILGDFAESPLLFSAEEQQALVHASVFAEGAGYPFKEALDQAIGKLRRYTNEEQLQHIERHAEGISVVQPPTETRLKPLLQMLEQAAADGQSVTLAYRKGKQDSITRVFDPYGLVHWKSHWYAVGFCHLRGENRSFRIDRMVSAALTTAHFIKPAHFSAKDFLLNSLLPGSLHSGLETVIIEGPEHALNDLCQHWMFGHALTERFPGKAVFRLGLSSLQTYAPYFLLPYGKELTVREPRLLLERLAEISRGIAVHYETMLHDNS